MQMTIAFEQGIEARDKELTLIDNPYYPQTIVWIDWINGWKLENWRILSNFKYRGKINATTSVNKKTSNNF